VIIHRTGETKYIRTNGVYDEVFIEHKVNEYKISLDDITHLLENKELPFIVEAFFNNESELCMRLLKHYGADDKNRFEVIFPDWNDISTDCMDNELLNLNSSLSKYDQLIFQWRDHLGEILCQCYNLCNYLNTEYSRINADTPPFGSPISIRSLKTSIIQNFVLYIEVIANFLVEVTISIDKEISGCRTPLHHLEVPEIEKITESRKYLRLEDKLEITMGMLAHLFNENYQLNKSSHMWSKFKNMKQKRDALTHTRIKSESTSNALSIDTVIPELKILDYDLVEGVEVISWFNAQVDGLFNSLNMRKNHNNNSFNEYTIILLFNVVAHINCVSVKKLIDKQNFSDETKMFFSLFGSFS
jgi:hypothetical protein